MKTYKVAIIGVGKIVEDQHLPVIAKNPRFQLAAVASQRGIEVTGAPTFRTPAEMYQAVPDIDAVAVCTPPQVRYSYAREALDAGKHVLLEKPSTTTVGELLDLRDHAAAGKRVLFTTWHSQYNAAVEAARRALAGQAVTYLQINWKEDVRRWHPGQKWIWLAGGFGVFDPGINALSIVTHILPDPVFIRRADLTFPENCDAPIAARIEFAAARPFEHLGADFDWRQTGEQTWEIEIGTAAGNRLKLAKGGSRLDIDGQLVAEEPMAEYEAIYDRFATLLDDGASLVDEAPLRLVADAFLIGKRITTDPFYD
ncbi:MAG: Gfo/Idh/MocA family oxidoreductase [Rhizobiales bacterium]|nr:Gfo/Idh/MocA family oxidoreductase [Hyphomicrobiales bacterium]MBN9009842.1 Gfo/Idh/MocA family oxidoreductase [Hyphomicrobiales bacterium]